MVVEVVVVVVVLAVSVAVAERSGFTVKSIEGVHPRKKGKKRKRKESKQCLKNTEEET